MKQLKILGSTVLAVVALTAILGVGSASATELCKESGSSCPAASLYKAGTTISAGLQSGTEAKLATSIDNYACKSSTIGGSTTSTGGSGTTPVNTTVSSLTLGACTDSFGNTCTMTSKYLPSSASFTGGGATFGFSVGKIGWNMKCGSSINCNMYMQNKTFPGENPSPSEPAKKPLIKLAGVVLQHEGGSGSLCPSTATFTATYQVNSPSPLYVLL